MLDPRRLVVAAVGAMILASACTSLGPASEPPSPAASEPVVIAATPPAALPSAVPSIAEASPSLALTPVPSRPPKTSKPVKSVAPSGPSLPNLVITKFTSSVDRVIVGAKTDGRVTIKNVGTADAGNFDLGISWAENNGLGGGAESPTAVDGLAAGDSVQVTVDISQTNPGDYTYTAQADSDQQVTESNEDDNTNTLAETAVSLANLAFAPNGFTITPDEAANNGYDLNMRIQNTGTADVTDSFDVGFTWYSDTTSGTFDPFECCTTEGGPVIAAGASTGEEIWSGNNFPAPGNYAVYAYLDSGSVVDESSEDDNEARFDITVP